jgi:hypothetical protein
MAIDRINATALLDGGVTTADIADDAVTTAKIAAGQVTSAKLDTNISVTGDLLVDNYTLYVDSANNRVGLGTGLPTTALTLGTSQTATVQNGGSTSAPAYGITSGALGVNGTYVPAANTLGFVVGGGERGRFTVNGLTFNGDTAAANALDDYEEGTWTPASGGGTAAAGSAAAYIKIGRSVTVMADVTFTGVTSPTYTITGLPFAVNSVQTGACIAWNNSSRYLSLIASLSTSRLELYNQQSSLQNINDNNRIIFSVTYET